MASPLSRNQEKGLINWLKAEGKPFSRPLSLLLTLSITLFGLRIASMWELSAVLHQVIMVKLAPDEAQLIGLALLFTGQAAVVFLKGSLAARTEQCITLHYQNRLYQQLRTFHLALLNQQPVAHWQAHFMKRSPAISQYYLDFQQQQKLASYAPLIVLAVVTPISWLVALILLVSAPLIPLFMWLTGMGAATAHREHFSAIDRLNHLFLDRLRGRHLIKQFHREKAELAKFDKAGTELKQRTLKVVRMAFLSSSVLDFFATVAMALVAVLVGFNLLGEISIGHWGETPLNFQQGLFLLLMTPLFFAELKLLGRYYHTKSEAVGAAAEFRPLLEQEPHNFALVQLNEQELNWPETQVLSRSGGALLSVVPFTLKAGDKIFLQGPSGSGKSVLLEALMGLRGLTGARSVLDRQQVAWLGQHTNLLPGSVRENLTLGESFADTQLTQALAEVELESWLAQLPQGLDTLMGEHAPLSGGQAQRLALARVLLFDKPMVLLDEPTAHLTQEQHASLTQLMQEKLRDKTVVWVSHRAVPQAWFSQLWQMNCNNQHEQPARVETQELRHEA